MRNHVSLSVTEDTQVGDARRLAMKLVSQAGMDDVDAGRVGVVATELARNLVKHSRDGELLLCTLVPPHAPGLEIISIDKGPGMSNIESCMRDGYSTAGTAGNGLGAVRRMSDHMDVYSVPGQGTVMLVRILKRGTEPARQGVFEVGAVNVPIRGESECGDAWLAAQQDRRILTIVADGLGHGPDAARAAEEAIRVVRESPDLDLCDLLDDIHAALRSTRGAAVSLAELRPGAAQVRYAGIGNVAGVVLGETPRSMVSHNGTLGHAIRRCQEFSYPWSSRSVLVMHSDGVSSQWDLRRYPGLLLRDPTVVAAVIYRDFKRGRDDATVLVARERIA